MRSKHLRKRACPPVGSERILLKGEKGEGGPKRLDLSPL